MTNVGRGPWSLVLGVAVLLALFGAAETPPDCGPVPFDPLPPISAPTEPMARCPAIRAEPHYCIGFRSEGVFAVGLHSGERCLLVDPEWAAGPSGSTAWSGDDVYVCSRWQPGLEFPDYYSAPPRLSRFSLIDGGWQATDIVCTGVAL